MALSGFGWNGDRGHEVARRGRHDGKPPAAAHRRGCPRGGQFFGLGLLGEVSARIYHECQGEKPYRIRTTRNLGRLTEEVVPQRLGTAAEKRAA